MAVAMKIGVEEIIAEVIAALHDTFKKGENKALLKRLGSRRRLDLVRKCSKSLRWMIRMCCFKVCCPTESDEDIARSCQDDTEANSPRNNGTEISLNLKITLEKEDSNLDKKRVFCAARRPPDFTVGFDKPMMELKTLLLKEEVHQLLLTAPAGCGKTTLVQMLCQDKQIKAMFANNILFVNVSKTPNVKVIVQILFSYKGYQPKYQIQSEEDAIYQLPQMLSHIGPNPILLILDDVWLGSEFLFEKFKFNIPNYKILVTSRTAFPRFKHTNNLKQLNDVDAMTLFCHSAFLQDETSYIPEEDIKKIVRGCGGFPLVLKMIGGSLCGQHAVVWHSRLLKWSDGHFFFNSDTELLPHLQKSLEFPDDKIIIKECFLDLGSFYAEQTISAAILIDMWAELYELDEDGIRMIANLQDLTIRNLANLEMTKKDASEVKSYYNEDFVTQHNILRELALYQSSQEPIGQRKRLITNISGANLPKWWMEQKQQPINARLLSISTEISTIGGGLDGVVIWLEELTAPQTGRFGDPVEFGSSLQIRVSVDRQGENSSGAVGSGTVNAGEERNRSSVRGRHGSGSEGRQGGLGAGGHGGDNGDDDGNNRRDRIIDIENERIPQRNPRQDELVAMVALYLPLAIGLIGMAFPLDDANLSALGSVLRCLALVCGIWSTVFFAGSLLEHGRNERMAWNLSIIGSILTTLGFILVIAIKLPLNLLWIAGLAILALLSIYLRSPWT